MCWDEFGVIHLVQLFFHSKQRTLKMRISIQYPHWAKSFFAAADLWQSYPDTKLCSLYPDPAFQQLWKLKCFFHNQQVRLDRSLKLLPFAAFPELICFDNSFLCKYLVPVISEYLVSVKLTGFRIWFGNSLKHFQVLCLSILVEIPEL